MRLYTTGEMYMEPGVPVETIAVIPTHVRNLSTVNPYTHIEKEQEGQQIGERLGTCSQ